MQAVILAGGFGTRISEETISRPKPMVEIGGKPILWHIMKIYFAHGIRDFIICVGHKGYLIKEYFANYFLHMSDITFDVSTNQMHVHQNHADSWRVTIVDTGDNTMTGGRLKRIVSYLDGDDFCFTYGDGLGDINITELVAHHRRQNTLATLTATQPPGRFGVVDMQGDRVKGFLEKPEGDGAWINAGFFVLSPKVVDYIDGDTTIWEKSPLESLAKNSQLSVYKHRGFWQPMDTLRDRTHLENLWAQGAPWKVWDNTISANRDKKGVPII